jgi:NAD(P)-dependent dehydrogenase (short-subunit alcohol dehydrogenase family)
MAKKASGPAAAPLFLPRPHSLGRIPSGQRISGPSARGQELRETLPIGRVVTAADVAALTVQLMANTALTGATYDIDGGQQFV